MSELREELVSRSQLKSGLELTASRSALSREPRPDLERYSSKDIAGEIVARQKVIYGEDDRQEIRDLEDQDALKNSESVAAIFKTDDVVDNGDGTVSLPSASMAQQFASSGSPLCEEEPFRLQPAGAICSAFLVGEDLVATAGHCLNENNLHTRRFVFGYQMISESDAAVTVPAGDVYAGAELLGWELDNDGADWAVVRLDRRAEGRPPLVIQRSHKVAEGARLYVIGHPAGLPKKYAGEAEVRNNDNEEYFVANLDTYGGNSGSPVFNADTHEVEGILVRGETDFQSVGSCVVSFTCPVQGCRGEDCTRVSLISGALT
jgi:hypothetical protein